MKTPPFRADHVGSFLRPKELTEARAKFREGAISAADLRAVEDEETAVTKAYWISAYHEVHDPEKLAAYAELAGPAITSAGGRFLARGVAAKAYEAGIEQRTVVVEFPSLDAAIACHDGDAYQAALDALAPHGPQPSSLDTCGGHASPLSQPQREFTTFNEQVARARRNRAPTSARDTARATRHLRACASRASPASTVRCGFARKIAPTTAIATEASAIAGRASSAPIARSLHARTIATPTAHAST